MRRAIVLALGLVAGLVAIVVVSAWAVTRDRPVVDGEIAKHSVSVTMLRKLLAKPKTPVWPRETPEHRANEWERTKVRERAEMLAERQLDESLRALGYNEAHVLLTCSPSCAITGIVSGEPCYKAPCPPNHPLAARTPKEAEWALRRLPITLFGRSAATGLRLEAVEEARFNQQNAVFRRELVPGIPCDRDVIVPIGPGTARLHVERYDGIEALPREPKHTRGEALSSALHQLEHLDPAETERPSEGKYIRLDPVLVASVGGRAALVHRFMMTLDELPYVVDVEDRSLEVVRFEGWGALEKSLAR